MGKPSSFAVTLANRLEQSLLALSTLSEILINNGGYKGDADDVNPAQINDFGEAGIQSAIKLIADMAHRDMCELATDLDIPHE